MSLTSFLANNADVRERLRQEFEKPDFRVKKELVAPPLTKRYSTVGTAFDYLLRFFIQRQNPNTVDREAWVAENAVDLIDDPTLVFKAEKIVSQARRKLTNYLKKKAPMSDVLVKSSLSLATLDPIFRAGRGHEIVGVTHKDDIRDLRNLISAVDAKLFTANKLCLVNPTFGTGSTLVGGADADVIIDDTIIDIKTTRKLSLKRSAFDQIMGYYVLHNIGGVGRRGRKSKIEKVAIYFSRYGYLHVMQLSAVVDLKTFPKFVQWFKRRAKKEFG